MNYRHIDIRLRKLKLSYSLFIAFLCCSRLFSQTVENSQEFFETDSILVLQTDSLTVLQTDTVPGLLILNDAMPDLDSIPALPDSLRLRHVMRQSDPLDTLTNRIFAFKVLSRNSYTRTYVPIDTTLTLFDINNPVMRNYYAGAFLGNLGLSYYPISFSDRKRTSDFFFLDNLKDYLHNTEEITYYHTQVPYTLINFSSAGPKILNESVFSLLHTQNVNKFWNVGLQYDIFASVGGYTNQNASNNGFSLFSAYRGNQYEMYAGFSWNNVRMRENGGLNDLAGFAINEDDASSNDVRSTMGRTITLNRCLNVTQIYSPTKITLGRNRLDNDTIEASRFAFVHTLKYEWTVREYHDTATYALGGREPNLLGSRQTGVTTHDSLHFRRISNHLELLLREQPRNRFTAGFSIGALIEMDRYNINALPDTVHNDISLNAPPRSGWGSDLPIISGLESTVNHRRTATHANSALTGSFFNHSGRFLNWDINGRLYFTGYKIGDVNIDGNARIHYFTAKGRNTLLLGGSFDNFNTGYFLNNFTSNLISWNNNFDMSQELRLRGEFMMPAMGIKVGAYLSQLNNHVYFNNDAMPQQATELLATGTAYVEADLRLWYFGFRFRLFGQQSSNDDIIPLPAFSGFQSTYFEGWLVKNVLTVQIGWNVIFNTPYNAYAYAPATGMFHLQDEQKIGNYPFFDFFANFKLSRARLFVKTEGFNTLLSRYGNLEKNNFMVYRYPTNDFRMKFGVSWAFYD